MLPPELARAEPMFISPLADPENRGAMSMGIAQNGPIVDSAKKNATLRQRATTVKLCDNNTGNMKARDKRKPPITTVLPYAPPLSLCVPKQHPATL
jgi:hypothetical protein